LIDPADPERLAALVRRHRIRLRHRLGQNFLADAGLRDRVAEAAGLGPNDQVLEVGAGVGTLTIALAARCRRLLAVEVDPQLLPALREVVRGHANVEVVHADVLKLDLPGLFPEGGQVVAGNIPYQLTGALMPRLLEPEPRPRRLSLVVQKEVAERWTRPGGGSLSTVAVHVFAQPHLELVLPAAAFRPPPRVDSALVVLEVRSRPAVQVDDLGRFFRLVERVFQERRKQLGGTLGRLTGRPAAEALRELGIDPRRRPETLDLAEWEGVYRSFGV